MEIRAVWLQSPALPPSQDAPASQHVPGADLCPLVHVALRTPFKVSLLFSR